MGLSLDKILRDQKDEDKIKNPFENWSKTGYGENTKVACGKAIKKMAEAVNANTEKNFGRPSINGSNGENKSGLLSYFGENGEKFLHFAVPSTLVFLAFLAICMSVIFRYAKQRSVIRRKIMRESVILKHIGKNNNNNDDNMENAASKNVNGAKPGPEREATSPLQIQLSLMSRLLSALKNVIAYVKHQVKQNVDAENGSGFEDGNENEEMEANKVDKMNFKDNAINKMYKGKECEGSAEIVQV